MVDLITEINRFPPFRLFPVTEINRPPYRRGGNRLRWRLWAGEVAMIDVFRLEQQTPGPSRNTCTGGAGSKSDASQQGNRLSFFCAHPRIEGLFLMTGGGSKVGSIASRTPPVSFISSSPKPSSTGAA